MEIRHWPTGWIERAPGWDDIDRVVEMCNARSQKLYGENQATRDDVRTWWTSPRFDLATDARLVLDVEGDVAGIVEADNPGEPYATLGCSAIVHPKYEGDAALWDWMHAWGLWRAQERVPLAAKEICVAAVTMMAAGDDARRVALERAGFRLTRVSNHMRIDLDSPPPAARWPHGVSVRTANIDQDLDAIVALYLETWRDHWGFVERPFDLVLSDWRKRIESDGERFDPTLWFVAVEGDEVAGISLCNSHIADDATRGYVQGLGVRPAWRKRGIALGLLHHTFAEFRQRRYAAVELDMDSENLTGALRVYERAGMRAVRQSLAYEKVLRPGIDVATRGLST
jgi:ribosomal protein S18 acetylase RimI-like enzyme